MFRLFQLKNRRYFVFHDKFFEFQQKIFKRRQKYRIDDNVQIFKNRNKQNKLND